MTAESTQEHSAGDRKPDPKEVALIDAMRPITEAAIERSVERDPSILGGSLHPIIGPAIRQAISNAFLRMIQSLNMAVENSLSAKSLKWRAEAWRTGKSFAEVVAIRTLLFRVEQAFLIEKKGGMLLNHASVNPSQKENADVISSMLSAVKDFVQDSFKSDKGSGLGTITVGETSLWIENGPQAALALMVRGNPPETLRERMADAMTTLEKVHLGVLEQFDGDTARFENCSPVLEALLLEEKLEPQTKEKKKIAVWPYALAGALLLGFLIFSTVKARRLHHRENAYIDWLREQTGVMLVSVQRPEGKLQIEALYDPLMPVSAEEAKRFELDPEGITIFWKPYVSLDPEVVAMRAEAKTRSLVSEFEKLAALPDVHPVRLGAAFQNMELAARDSRQRPTVRVETNAPGGAEIAHRLESAGVPATAVTSSIDKPNRNGQFISVDLQPQSSGMFK